MKMLHVHSGQDEHRCDGVQYPRLDSEGSHCDHDKEKDPDKTIKGLKSEGAQDLDCGE